MARVPYVTTHLDSLSDFNDYLFTCTIVRGEILFGIQRLPTGRRRQVLALDAILVTADSDFQRIAGFGLQLEDWTN